MRLPLAQRVLLQVEGGALGVGVPADEPEEVLEARLGLGGAQQHLLVGAAAGASASAAAETVSEDGALPPLSAASMSSFHCGISLFDSFLRLAENMRRGDGVGASHKSQRHHIKTRASRLIASRVNGREFSTRPFEWSAGSQKTLS